MKLFRLILRYMLALSFMAQAFLAVANTSTQWFIMQQEYIKLVETLNDRSERVEQMYYHPYWAKTKENIRKFLLGPVNQHFGLNHDVGDTMVRQGFDRPQMYELAFLQYCTGKRTRDLLETFKDTDFIGTPFECKELNCSTSTLGHLFYAAKVLEKCQNKDIRTIVEFGGGYGNLARIFKSVLPHITIIMIDLPEVIALQAFFLRSTLPITTKVIIHTQAPTQYESGTIHLIPVHEIENITVNTDVFISTFALSETTKTLQQVIIDKKFFNANICYIAGQLHGGCDNFVNKSLIHDSIRQSYSITDCQPFHWFGFDNYEITGTINKQSTKINLKSHENLDLN